MTPNKKIKNNQTVYAFIDSQNLNFGTSKDVYTKIKKRIYKGWKLDFRKFRVYLKDKFNVSKAFLFIGYISENQKMYDHLKDFGFELVFKPTVKDMLGKPKGNVDAEIVLHAAKIEFKNYTKAIIVSGDGDFLCLHEDLIKENKLLKIIIPNQKSESSLLKNLQKFKVFIEKEKKKLEFE